MRAVILGLILLACPALGWASTAVEDVRAWNGPERLRVVFDLSAPVDYEMFTLINPARSVIDLQNATIATAKIDAITAEGPLQRIRSSNRDNGVRLVLDLDQSLTTRVFTAPPNATYGHRLVVDIEKPAQAVAAERAPVRTAPATDQKPFVVAIDAGHGGEDPGAIGASGTYEKDIVLTVARKLADRINRVQGLQAVLIRDGDYYIGLRERTRKAREAEADLFVSLHADAFHDRRVKGSSVFVLSRNGASSEMARVVARRENQADQIGGVSLQDKDEELASVLVDLTRANTVEESVEAAEVFLVEMGAIGDVHGGGVEQAGFAVLKSLDMASVLVELAFISNPDEEKRLKSSAYQHRLADGLLHGVRAVAARQRPELALKADEYTVKRGDTLSGIAQRHAVSVRALRQANNLGGDRLLAGRTLRIP